MVHGRNGSPPGFPAAFNPCRGRIFPNSSDTHRSWVAGELFPGAMYGSIASAAARGNQQAYEHVVTLLDDSFIGPDMRSAKPFDECR